MKTPRDMLLDSHRAAEPDLDAIRRDVIASLRPALDSSGRSPLGFVAGWREFVRRARPARLARLTLGAAWLIIIGLNLASTETEPAPRHNDRLTERSNPQEMQQALREQRQLFLEMVNTPGEPAESDRFVPRPRGEVKPTWACV